MNSEITRRINRDAGISLQRIETTIRLIQEGASIPFIARYRKEATGNLDEVQLRQIAERYLHYGMFVERRGEILSAIETQDRLTPELREQINECDRLDELEDLYLPYRSKRQSKANLARRRGLEPLADYIHQQSGPQPVEDVALKYISCNKKVPTVRAAIEGALHIVAERISGDISYRKWLRNLMLNEGILESKVVKGKEEQKTKYSTYYNFSEPVAKIPSHRFLAIRRGAREKVLSFSIQIDDEKACAQLKSLSSIDPLLPSANLIESAISDSYERLLKPVIQNDVRNMLRNRAEDEAIKVFEENLSSLLLAPAAGPIPVMGIEPNLKGGSRLAVVGPDGLLLEHHTLRLKEPRQEESKPDPKPEVNESGMPGIDATPPNEQEPGSANQQQSIGELDATATVEAEDRADDRSERQAIPEIDAKANVELKPQPSPEVDSEPGDDRPTMQDAEIDAKADIESKPQPNPEVSSNPSDEPTPNPDARTEIVGEANTGQASQTSANSETNGVTEPKSTSPAESLADILNRTQVRGIVIGNGAGARAAETFVRTVLKRNNLDVFVAVAKEGGAGVYASSSRAREEFPSLDAASRGAISIARRLQDPLAELVKIDPKAIGVGQYQHDVDQKKLRSSLGAAVESAVNRVGVNLNDASIEMLKYISGVSPEVAQAIVDYRKFNGPFTDRNQLRQVQGVDDKVFEQASGFLRLKRGTQPLDRTSVHPERYPLVEQMAASINTPVAEIVENQDRVRSIKFEEFEKQVGRPTLVDIRQELLKPGRDPRKKFAVPRFRDDVHEVGDLKAGMELEGIVTNVTNFGAFVDVGVQQDGLVHISELSHRYVSDARQAAQVGDVVKVKVIGVDSGQKRISLSIKAAMPKPQPRAAGTPASGDKGRNRRPRTKEAAMATRKKPRRPRSDRPGSPSRPPEPVRQLSMEEKIRLLQEKFKGPDR